MVDDNPIFAYAGAYAIEDEARADFETIKDAHAAGLIGKYDSALFTKQGDGKVKVKNTDSTTRTKGAGWGAVVGGVVGLLFPPALIGSAIVGAAGGGLIGDIAKGWGHGDIKDLGEALDAGEWGVVLVCESTPGPGRRPYPEAGRQSRAEADRGRGRQDPQGTRGLGP